MTAGEVVGSVSGVRQFPIDPMAGESMAQGAFTEKGLVGDRSYAIVDSGIGDVASAKSVRLFPKLPEGSATYYALVQLPVTLPTDDDKLLH